MSSALMTRSVAVARMHLVDRITMFVMPVVILLAAFVLNLVIWAFVPVDGRHSGAAGALPFFILVAAMFAVVRGLPFALGMGSSRRAFVLGTGLAGAVLSLVFGTVFLLLGALERVSDGWGLGGTFFWFPWFEQSSWPVVWLMFVLGMLASFVVGAAASAVYARWSMVGLIVALPVAVLVVGGASVLITWQHWWTGFWHWFAVQSPLSTAGWLAVLVVAMALAGWGTLRRARA